jgi:hypothetical protein
MQEVNNLLFVTQPASVDTVALIVKDNFSVALNHSLRIITASCMVSNLSKEDKENGIYRPKISITTYGLFNGPEYLKMEFSVNKLVNGHNLGFITAADVDTIFENLKRELSRIGISITDEALRNAYARRLDVAKNFFLPASMLIAKTLMDINSAVKKFPKSDLANIAFKNGGQGVTVQNGAEMFIAYDKVADYKQSLVSLKRAFEGDYYSQRQIMEELAQQNTQMLRLEVRFLNYQKISKSLGGNKKHYTLGEILRDFDLDAILLKRWQFLTDFYAKFPLNSTEADILFGLLQTDGKIMPTKVFSTLGWCLCAQKFGAQTLTDMLKPYLTQRQLSYFLAEIAKEVKPLSATNETLSFISQQFQVAGDSKNKKPWEN